MPEDKIYPTKNIARVAGFWYVLASVTEFFNFAYVLPTLIVSGNATATAGNIMASGTLFRIGIVGELISAFIGRASQVFMRRCTRLARRRSW